jgi:hypothetical protein
MATALPQTKLYAPPPRTELVARLRLIGRLGAGIHRKLTLISTLSSARRYWWSSSDSPVHRRSAGPCSCLAGTALVRDKSGEWTMETEALDGA